ncbi:MAG: family 10 glycosylhydrolase [Planctomycetota bacterium]
MPASSAVVLPALFPALFPALCRALCLGAFLLASAAAQATELRGVWVARDGLTSRSKIVQTLDQLAAANVNLVCVNVWSRGYTIHPSDVLFAACGVQQDPDYVGRDPLQEFVVEAHLRGIEVEAWFEYGFMFGWNGWYAGPTGIGPVLTANPTWIGRDVNGNTQVSDGGTGFFTWASHECPAVRQFLIDLGVEVADRYDVDGIQFDRCRYPSTSWGYDSWTTAAYQQATGQTAPTGNVNNAQWKRWRADRLIAWHTAFYNAVKARRPGLRVTDAPTVMPGAYDNFLQDWPQWVVTGSLDLVYPQVYRTTASSYVTTLDQQLAYLTTAQRQKVAPGIRAITGTPTNEVLAMVGADRARSLPGHVFWYAEGLYDDLPSLTAQYFQQPAAVPGRPANWRPIPTRRDDGDASTTSTPGFAVTGLPGAVNLLCRVAPATASANDKVTYSVPVPEAGLYALLVSTPGAAGYCPQAPHGVATASGPATIRANQAALRAGWTEVGTVWLNPGVAAVEVRALPGTQGIADGVALLRSRLRGGQVSAAGTGTAGSLGGTQIAALGRAGLGGALRLQASRTPPLTPLMLGLGFAPASVPLYGGTLYVVPDVVQFFVADTQGLAELPVAVPFSPALVGTMFWAQALASDATNPSGVSLSPGVAVVLQ